tara:strand:- start:578 stop:1357 length:780 start_codon:yes stop_codon:yes gene_type:complete
VLPKIFKPYKSSKKNLIRVGPNIDGGYIIDKRVINKIKTLITCGLNDDWEFEKEFLKINPYCKILAYDHTVNTKYWVSRFKKDLISFFLLKKLNLNKILDIFKYVNYINFFKENNKHYIKKVVLNKNNKKEISIRKILKNQKNILLKIDIEGDEYKILNAINNDFDQIYLLIIEFHNIHKNINKIKNFLTKSKFKLIHIHGNNFAGVNKNKDPNVVEMTMLNSKKFKLTKSKSDLKYPIYGLDYKNFKRRDDIELNFND